MPGWRCGARVDGLRTSRSSGARARSRVTSSHPSWVRRTIVAGPESPAPCRERAGGQLATSALALSRSRSGPAGTLWCAVLWRTVQAAHGLSSALAAGAATQRAAAAGSRCTRRNVRVNVHRDGDRIDPGAKCGLPAGAKLLLSSKPPLVLPLTLAETVFLILRTGDPRPAARSPDPGAAGPDPGSPGAAPPRGGEGPPRLRVPGPSRPALPEREDEQADRRR